MFENLCTAYGESAIYSTPFTYVCGQILCHLTSCISTTEGFATAGGACMNKAICTTWETPLWGNHPSTNNLFTEKGLKLCGAFAESATYRQNSVETTLWWNDLSTNISFQAITLWKSLRGICRQCHIFNSVKLHFAGRKALSSNIWYHEVRRVWKPMWVMMRKVTHTGYCEKIPWTIHLSTSSCH